MEAELATTLQCVLRQHRQPGSEIRQRRGVSGGRFGALASNQIQLSQMLPLVPIVDQCGATIELIDNIENRVLATFQ